MKLKLIISVFLFSILFTQDRATIFSTGSDDPNPAFGGYPVRHIGEEIYGAADRFFLSNEYMLERIYLYLSFAPENDEDEQLVEVQICEDNNGIPGEALSTQTLSLDLLNSSGKWYSISLLEECVRTQPSSNYWIVVLPFEGTNATWVYSEEDNFYYSTTENGGETWSHASIGKAGSAGLTGEQIYVPPFDGGDINGDFVVNILDVVAVVQYILGNTEFNEDQIAAADLTQDGVVNILDVIAMMNMIITSPEVVSDFLYEDINVNSETFGQLVGPPIYQGMITGYYFGKAG